VKVVLDARNAPGPPASGTVATVGVFDGVHLGHQAILAEATARARSIGAVPAVLTFRQHPRLLLTGSAPPQITSLEHRLVLLERAGIELCLVADFDANLRDTSAGEFVRHWLVGRLGVRLLVSGPDAKLGKDRQGTPPRLAEMGAFLGFGVVVVPPVSVGGRPARSSTIREAIAAGDLGGAAAMLGRRVSLLGTVVHGDARGAALGFPTANLDLHHELHPPAGVYAVEARLDGKRLRGVVNIGTRPTFGAGAVTVEVHLLDFEGDLYGRDLEVEFLEKLREERRFASREDLVAQVRRDVERARAIR
jgi:riboflavin kinase/FMN adenylyltransferase